MLSYTLKTVQQIIWSIIYWEDYTILNKLCQTFLKLYGYTIYLEGNKIYNLNINYIKYHSSNVSNFEWTKYVQKLYIS